MRDWLVALIMPPKKGASEDQLYIWRVTIGIAIILLAAVSMSHMAWSVGWQPFDGTSGFVQKHEFQELASDVRKGRLNALRTAILSTLRESCAADGRYKLILQEQLADLQVEWNELQGSRFPTPSCAEVR